MQLDSTKICFGLSEQKDKESFSTFLQLAGRKDFVQLLSERLNSEEIDEFVTYFTQILKTHFSEDEYHDIFLLDKNHTH